MILRRSSNRSPVKVSAEDTFPQIVISDILQLPIPAATDSQQSPIIERVQKILAAKNVGANGVRPPFVANGNIDNDADKGACHAPLQESSTNISALEAECDRLVYELYSLTEEEIALVEGKR